MGKTSLRVLAFMLLAIAATVPTTAADDSTSCFGLDVSVFNETAIVERGIAACTRLIAVRTGPGQAAAFRGRGFWRHNKGEYDAAMADFNIAINLEPRHVEGYSYRADTWRAQGNLDRALGDLEMATRLDPTYAAAYYIRGEIYEEKGDIARAREHYNAALAVPAKNREGEWAHKEARRRLSKLGQ